MRCWWWSQAIRSVDLSATSLACLSKALSTIRYVQRISYWYMLMVEALPVAVNGVKVGDSLVSGQGAAPEVGVALYLADIHGTIISNIEMRPGQELLLLVLLVLCAACSS